MDFDRESFITELDHRRRKVENCLESYLPDQNAFPALIHSAMNYAVMNGGKRLRPIMVIETGKIGGLTEAQIMRAACAVEMIHCYSLVHDDLPAMDNDDFRRGKPTCHKVYGEDIAILTGDALLTRAFELLAECAVIDGLDSRSINKAILLLAKSAGSCGMVGGQVLDLKYEQCSVSHAELEIVHSLKTGALFDASLQIGAVLGGLLGEKQEMLRHYAGNFGLAYQISDDILDVCGQESVMGKPVGSDIRNEKTTYISLFGLEKSRSMASNMVERCLDNLSIFGPEADFLRRLARFTIERQA